MKKVTEEIKEVIKESRKKGLTFAGIGKILNLSMSTVQYHASEDQRKKTKDRAAKNRKVWAGQKEYMKNYMAERRSSDPEFNERVRKHARKSWRRLHGKK